jgi:hypothetical protein
MQPFGHVSFANPDDEDQMSDYEIKVNGKRHTEYYDPTPDPDWPWKKVLLAMLASVPDEVLREAKLVRHDPELDSALGFAPDTTLRELTDQFQRLERSALTARTEALSAAEAAVDEFVIHRGDHAKCIAALRKLRNDPG